VKYICLIMLMTLCLSHEIRAQIRDNKNLIFFEFGGNGGAYSINYDRTLINNFGARAGIMLLPSASGTIKAFPVLFNYRININNNFVEIGLGETLFSAPLNFGNLGNFTDNSAIPTGVIALGIQNERGMNFRTAFTPFYYNKKFVFFGGFSLGYSF